MKKIFLILFSSNLIFCMPWGYQPGGDQDEANTTCVGGMVYNGDSCVDPKPFRIKDPVCPAGTVQYRTYNHCIQCAYCDDGYTLKSSPEAPSGLYCDKASK
ncbi:hypothetical protein A3F66_04215 [candidate division TM6 bacterium RIFCSPHIGHO2_12_FULL_32_22]|nr:MAG: hypothetical protein A3F66_04215 [candidate division TM6 bacterium RIFCSPHIGHO2_12_FULL_32_22]